MLAEALEAEVQAYIEAARDERDQRGHALVVRNGYAREREILLGAGAVEVRAPRVNDKRMDADGKRKRFKSVILPPYMRRSPKVCEVLPLLYLHGLSSGDFLPALREFFGSEAGLSASTVTRLTAHWQSEREGFMRSDLSKRDYVYVWVDGIHTGVRLGSDDRLCCLVMVGARLDGTKELVAISDGYRESTESWAELLRDLKRRGMRPPVLAVGDGALGFWGAVRDVFPETLHQRDWVHKTSNVLDSMPKSVHKRAKKAIHEITEAEDKAHAERAIEAFASEFGAKWPKAVAKIVDDKAALLRFYDFPAEHWRHLRTTNPIESTFAPVRARTDITKGPGSREAALAMIFKLMEAAEGRWRRLNGSHLVPLVRAGAKFVNGELVEGSSKEKVAA
jgi:putative transposase